VQQWSTFEEAEGPPLKTRLWLIVFVRDEARRFYLAESADVHAASCAACRRKPSTVGFPTRFHRRVCAVERRQLRFIEQSFGTSPSERVNDSSWPRAAGQNPAPFMSSPAATQRTPVFAASMTADIGHPD